MNNFLARVFVSALVRRCAYVLVACISMYACQARAATDTHPDRAQAYSHCQSSLATNVSPWISSQQSDPATWTYSVTDSGSCKDYKQNNIVTGYQEEGAVRKCLKPANTQCSTAYFTSSHINVHKWSAQCPAGATWDDVSKTCSVPCSQQPPLGGGYVDASLLGSGSTVCRNGCLYSNGGNTVPTGKRVDGVVYVDVTGWGPKGDESTCALDAGTPFTAPPPDNDGDGVSDGNDPAPNNPGIGDPQDPPTDPEDCGQAGKPSCTDNGDGKKNTSQGGGNCSVAPQSSGDGILSMIAYQTWATRCEAEAQKALMQASLDKQQALIDLDASKATASKQDDIKAQIALSAAQLAQLQAAQTVEIQATNARLSQMDTNRTNEITATNTKVQALDDRNKAEQDETQAKIDAFNESNEALTQDTNAKLEALKGLGQDALDKMTASGMTAQEAAEHLQDILSNILLDAPKQDSIKTNTQASADALAVIRDAQATQAEVAHADAGDLKAKMDALKATIDDGVNVHCDNCDGSTGSTDMTETNGLLGDIKGKLSDIAIGISPLAGIFNVASQISEQIDSLRDEFGSLSEWFKQTGAGTHDPTGEDADPSTVSRVVEIGADGFDQSGFGYSRSCPQPVSVEVMGQTVTIGTDVMCSWLALGGWFVLLITAWKCINAVVSA